MRIKTTLFVAALLAIVNLTSTAIAEDAKPRDLVKQAIKAAGGKKNLAKFNSYSWSEQGTFYGMGDGIPYTGEYSANMPDQFRMEIEGVFTIIVNGDQGWVDAAGNVVEMNDEQLAEQKAGLYVSLVSSLLPLDDKKFKLKSLGEKKTDRGTLAGISVNSKGHREVRLYFDSKTHLLVRTENKVKLVDQGNKEVAQTAVLSAFKKVEGARIATKMDVHHDGEKFIEAAWSDFKVVKKFDKGTFAKP